VVIVLIRLCNNKTIRWSVFSPSSPGLRRDRRQSKYYPWERNGVIVMCAGEWRLAWANVRGIKTKSEANHPTIYRRNRFEDPWIHITRHLLQRSVQLGSEVGLRSCFYLCNFVFVCINIHSLEATTKFVFFIIMSQAPISESNGANPHRDGKEYVKHAKTVVQQIGCAQFYLQSSIKKISVTGWFYFDLFASTFHCELLTVINHKRATGIERWH